MEQTNPETEAAKQARRRQERNNLLRQRYEKRLAKLERNTAVKNDS